MGAEVPLLVDDATAVALAVAAVLGVLELEGPAPVVLEPLLGDEDVDVVPGQALVDRRSRSAKATSPIVDVLDRLVPRVHVEVAPSQPSKRAPFEGRLDEVAARRSERLTSPSRKVVLDLSAPELHPAVAREAGIQDALATLGLLDAELRRPTGRA